MKVFHLIKNEKGFELVTLLIAAFLVAVIAGGVAFFVSSQSQISKTIADSSTCESLASSVNAYLQSTDNNLEINTVGINPATGAFSADINNIDGQSRFNFTPVNVATIPNPNINLATSVVRSDGLTISLHNYLNINNSFNRLLSMQYSANICNNAVIFDDRNNINLIDGLNITRNNVRISLDIEILENNGDLCNAGGLARLPQTYNKPQLNYTITAEIDTDVANPKRCQSRGSFSYIHDRNPPLVAVDMQPLVGQAGACPATTAGAYCIHGSINQTGNIVALVRTISENDNDGAAGPDTGEWASDSQCRQCLAALTADRTCASFSYPRATSCVTSGACRYSDPGSVFFCRMHAGSNFALATDQWWPCHTPPATITTEAGNVIAHPTVTIAYNNNPTEPTTEATITVSGLSSGRNWFLDVRAVDASGFQFGTPFSRPNDSGVTTNLYAQPNNLVECRCNESCSWNCEYGICSENPVGACACDAGNPNGTLETCGTHNLTSTYCRDPLNNPTTSIDPGNCLTPSPCSPTNACQLPCVGPSYQCSPQATWTEVAPVQCNAVGCGSVGNRLRRGICYDTTPNPDVVVANSNCAGNCEAYDGANCAGPACSFTCNYGGWGACSATGCVPPDNIGVQTRPVGQCWNVTNSAAAPIASCAGIDGGCNNTSIPCNFPGPCPFSCDYSSPTVITPCDATCATVNGTRMEDGVCRDAGNNAVAANLCNGGAGCARTVACTKNCGLACSTNPATFTPSGAATCSGGSCGGAGTIAGNQACLWSIGGDPEDGTDTGNPALCPGSCATTGPCTMAACADCGAPGGGTIAHGSSGTFYSGDGTCGNLCSSESRTCTDGVLSGSFTGLACTDTCVPSCSPDAVCVPGNPARMYTYCGPENPTGTSCGLFCQGGCCYNAGAFLPTDECP